MFSVSIRDDQDVDITILGEVDKKGNDIPVSGTPVFASGDDTVCTFTPNPSDSSGLTGTISAKGPLASAAVVTITIGSLVENGAVEIVADPDSPAGLKVSVGTPTIQA